MKKTIAFLIAILIACGANCFAQGKVSRTAKQTTTTKQTKKQIQKQPQKTKPLSGVINGHEWVDLGLPSGTKWATCNLGADAPEEWGDYFAWGETRVGKTFTINSCALGGKDKEYLMSNGIITANGDLTLRFDVANYYNGNLWRMPTKIEFEELIANCRWEWTQIRNVNGYKITGPSGMSIFLPVAGQCDEKGNSSQNEYGDYWSSSAADVFSYYLFLSPRNFKIADHVRWYGRSIRPVISNPN